MATSSSPAKTDVHVTVTYSDWNAAANVAEASAIVDGVVESAATCTLTLTQGAVVRTIAHRATPSASSTQCGRMAIPGAQLHAGDWSATVRYESAKTYGSSARFTIRVIK
ncbi:MAG: hypothetical protein ACRDLR_04425 [Gaiellaceae bacterium]